MPRLLEVKFSLSGMIREDKDTSAFVSFCPALELYSAGRTRPEAKRALQSAVDMFVRLCYDRGTLGRILREKGFESSPALGIAAPDATPADGDFIAVVEDATIGEYDDVFQVDVPLHLVAHQQAQAVPCRQ